MSTTFLHENRQKKTRGQNFIYLRKKGESWGDCVHKKSSRWFKGDIKHMRVHFEIIQKESPTKETKKKLAVRVTQIQNLSDHALP